MDVGGSGPAAYAKVLRLEELSVSAAEDLQSPKRLERERETERYGREGLRKWATPWTTLVSLGTVDITVSVSWRFWGSLPIPAAAIQGPPVPPRD